MRLGFDEGQLAQTVRNLQQLTDVERDQYRRELAAAPEDDANALLDREALRRAEMILNETEAR